MTSPIVARKDPSLNVRITGTRPLAHKSGNTVHGGAGLARAGDRIVLLEDGADTIAIIEGEGSSVIGLPLARSPGPPTARPGYGQTGSLQLEAVVGARDWKGEYLLAFGAGSTPDRRRVARVRLDPGNTDMALYDTRGLYEALDGLDGFATSVLDIEGVALVPRASAGRDAIRLFQRGHGRRKGDLPGLPATVDMRLEAFLAYLDRCKRDPSAFLGVDFENVRRYDLGTLAGVPIGFTDAAGLPDGRVVYVGTAEMGLEEGEGEVISSVLGVIELDGSARWNVILDEDGEPTLRGAEGIVILDEKRGYVAVDQLERQGHATLCDVTIAGL